MAHHHNPPPKIKYFRNTHSHITRQRRHRLSLKRFGVDRSCLQPSRYFDNMTHVTVPVAHGTWHCCVTLDFPLTVGGGVKGVRNYATTLYLRFEFFGMWGCVLGKQRRGPACPRAVVPSERAHRVGSQTARVSISIHTALISRNSTSNDFFDYSKTRLH